LNGLMAATVRDCYATGNIVGGSSVGGLIGGAFDNSTTSNSYSTGSVSGTASVGGFMGQAAEPDEMEMSPGATITNCFWDSEVSGNATSAAGVAKTTEEMKTLSTYTDGGWDFVDETVNGSNNYWGINNTVHDGYPFLSWEDYTHNYSDTPLPVTLTSFEVKNNSGVVELTWTTESETENLGYIIERKVNRDWDVIASYQNDSALTGCGSTSKSHSYSYTDVNVLADQSYEYRLSDVSESNEITQLMTINITTDASNALVLEEFGLKSAFPNPFNPMLTIRYGLTEDAQTRVNILNLQGKTIARLENKFQKAGNYEIQWQAGNAASGIYLVEVVSGKKSDLKKVLLTK
jgi:type IX secretion system substrate protein/GLUG motif-containing protein